MNLNPQNTIVIGYASPGIGNVWFTEEEQHRPTQLRMRDIILTPGGPRVVIGILNGGVALSEVEGPDAQEEARS